MSWAYPQNRPSTGLILDNQEFNENLSRYADEVNGNLNEHNFAVNCVPNMIDNGVTEPDIVSRLYSTKNAVNPHAATTSMVEIPRSLSWQGVDGAAKTIVSRGGLFLVFISFQLHCPTAASAASGLNFCIGLDGSPRMDTLLGTGDQSNDFLDTAFGATVGGGEVTWDFGTSPSFKANQERKLVTGLFRVSPGSHIINLMARNLFTTSGTQNQYISSREVIVLELWA